MMNFLTKYVRNARQRNIHGHPLARSLPRPRLFKGRKTDRIALPAACNASHICSLLQSISGKRCGNSPGAYSPGPFNPPFDESMTEKLYISRR